MRIYNKPAITVTIILIYLKFHIVSFVWLEPGTIRHHQSFVFLLFFCLHFSWKSGLCFSLNRSVLFVLLEERIWNGFLRMWLRWAGLWLWICIWLLLRLLTRLWLWLWLIWVLLLLLLGSCFNHWGKILNFNFDLYTLLQYWDTYVTKVAVESTHCFVDFDIAGWWQGNYHSLPPVAKHIVAT